MYKKRSLCLMLYFATFLLGFMGCSSAPTVLTGRYSDGTRYFDFAADGTYSYNSEMTGYTTTGTYNVTDGKVILDSNDTSALYIVKNYLCISVNGSLPKDYSNATLLHESVDRREIISLKEDMTFTYSIYSPDDNQFIDSFNGTYIISQNKVICTEEEGKFTDTFLEEENKVYHITYIKE